MADLDYLKERARSCRLLAREASNWQAARELEELALAYEWQIDCYKERTRPLPIPA